MHLENISLTQFKNYNHCQLKFSRYINCIVGPNGSGKTNMLDAINYLSVTKSAFNNIEQQNIQHQQNFFSIRGCFSHEQKRFTIQCSCKRGSKKVIQKDKTPYTRLSEHIGSFPSVLITPYDTDILREGSVIRRRFVDGILSQTDQQYLQNLLKYQRLLSQRNQLLKDFYIKHRFDSHLIDSYDQPMLRLMRAISDCRDRFLQGFVPVFKRYYETLSDAREEVELIYSSDLLNPDFNRKFLNNHQKDLDLHRTELGIHKDDLICRIRGYPVRKFGSQGQQKSFVIALRLAQFEWLQTTKGFKPILLLDDIFDKLDDRRIEKLMEMVSGKAFGQIFITDSRPDRTARILENVPFEINKYLVENGRVTTA